MRSRKPSLRSIRDVIASFFGLILGFVALVLTVVIGVVGSILLTLAAPLLLIPGIKLVLQPIVDKLVAYVGDVATYQRHPLRAAAMEGVILNRIVHAHELLKDAPGSLLIIIAHSQGSAMTVTTLLGGGLGTENWQTRVQLNTVGTAVSLITESTYLESGTDDGYTPVARWASERPEIGWENFWGIWDPVPSGPMGDNDAQRDARWRESYTRQSTDVVGPGEHPVHNTSSPFTDHQSYASNILQVIDPIVDQISPTAGGLIRAEVSAKNRATTVAIRRSRPVMAALSVVIALSVFGWWSPEWLDWIPWAKVIPAVVIPFIPAVLITLVLVWAYGSWSTALERSLVWPKPGSTRPSTMKVVTPLAIYSAAAIVVALALLTPMLGGWVWLVAVLLVGLGVVLVVSVFSTPPRPLPERRGSLS